MGAFDHLSDDDPRVIAHEERKLHANCGLQNYSLEELKAEVAEREAKIEANRKLLSNTSDEDLKAELKRRGLITNSHVVEKRERCGGSMSGKPSACGCGDCG